MIIGFSFSNTPITESRTVSVLPIWKKVVQFVFLQASAILQRLAEGLLSFSAGQWS